MLRKMQRAGRTRLGDPNPNPSLLMEQFLGGPNLSCI